MWAPRRKGKWEWGHWSRRPRTRRGGEVRSLPGRWASWKSSLDEGSRGLPGISLGTNDRDEGLEEILRVEAVDLEGFVEPVEPAEVGGAAGHAAAEKHLGGRRPAVEHLEDTQLQPAGGF